MECKDFVYWLQGFFEISEAKELNARQVEIIKNHLNMVFKHDIDPKAGDAEHQAELDQAHTGYKQEPHWNPNTLIRC